MPNQQHARKPVKTNSSSRALATCKPQTSFSLLVQTGNHVVQKFDTRKIYKHSNEVTFFSPFFVCFSLFAFKLGATAMLCLRYWFIYQTGNKKLTGCQILCSCALRFAAVFLWAGLCPEQLANKKINEQLFTWNQQWEKCSYFLSFYILCSL